MAPHAVHIDPSGEYIASCSDEGRVVVRALYANETATYDYGEALTCVRLAPGYARTNEVAIGSYDGQLRLKSKNWFGQMKDEDVFADTGASNFIGFQSFFNASCLILPQNALKKL